MTELILALDVRDRERALEIAAICAPHIDAIKIGYPLALSASMGIFHDLATLGLPLIADFKVADIPATNRSICSEAFQAGADAIICHGFTGGDAIGACAEVAHGNGGECYVVAEMSHPGAVTFFHGGVAEQIASLATESGADGIIAPATRPDRVQVLRRIVGDKKIYAPGVGTQGGDANRIAHLVNGIIVGRTIYADENPARAAAGIAAMIHSRRF
ncbi:MAG: orotidine-5'-phosphate decarboxylase [Methanomicrobiales archaeon]|nr:orotidine-5'-phosphate decarboxylase [Methanomicrobiales archaeon]